MQGRGKVENKNMVKDILDKYEPKESLGSYIVLEKQTSRQKASLRRVRFIIWYKKFVYEENTKYSKKFLQENVSQRKQKSREIQ